MRKITAVLAIGIGLAIFATAGQARAATVLQASEYQVTFDANGHTVPIIGRDAVGDYIIYSQYPFVNGLPGKDTLYYQRVSNGAPQGSPVRVSDSPWSQYLADADGDYIVYTSTPVVGAVGYIVLFQISTGQSLQLTSAGDAYSPRICGDVVVWIEEKPSGTQAVMYRISSGVPVQTSVIAGPVPTVGDMAVGNRFIVWSQWLNNQYSLVAYDVQSGNCFPVGNDPQLNEYFVSTDGPWIACEASSVVNPTGIAIVAFNVDTGERRSIADNGANNQRPRVSGNLITYESSVSGSYQIYVYRIQENDTFQVTGGRTGHYERLNDLKGNLVTYVDSVGDGILEWGNGGNVYASTLAFNNPPVADAGPDQAITLIGSTVHLDGSQSYDPDGDPITYQWSLLSRPDGSAAELFNSTVVNPTFVADVHGTYIIQLVVSDPSLPSVPKTVTVSFNNIKPVAAAGTSQSVALGDTVNLNGSGSTDANGDSLTYQWSLVSGPSGSNVAIADPTAVQTSFVPDLQGLYVVKLVVNDGFTASDPNMITIQVTVTANTVIKTIQTILQLQISALPSTAFKSANMQNTLLNKLNAVIQQIDAGNYAIALDQLQNDILGKVDGVYTTGKPDKNDWIADPVAQLQIYNTLIQIIADLKAM